MNGTEQEEWMQGQAAQLDAMRRAQVQPMTLKGLIAWVAVGVMVVVIVVGSLWLVAWAG